MKKVLLTVMAATLALSMVACGNQGMNNEGGNNNSAQISDNVAGDFENLYPEFIVGETEDTVTYINYLGEETTVTKNLERTVSLFNSILDIWYLSGGEAIARVSGDVNVPEEAMDIVDLGTFNQVSIEALLELEPDLVLMHTTTSHTDFIEMLEMNGVESAVIDTGSNPYDAFVKNTYLLSKIAGTEDVYDSKVSPVIEESERIIKKANQQEETPLVGALFTTSKGVSAETENAQTGEMVKMLGGENIVTLDDLISEEDTRVDLSFELLLEQDPDVILILPMGDEDGARQTIKDQFETNAAWNSLTAVQNDNVYYMPKDLFVSKPNARYPEALKQLAEIMYPGIELE